MNNQFIQYIINLYQDIPSVVYWALLFVLGVSAVLIFALKGVRKGWRKVSFVALAEYLFLTYSSTLFFRKAIYDVGYNFVPFWSYAAIIREGKEQLLVENIMNVVVFVPVGLLLGSAFWSIRWWQVILIGGGISISIEALQYFTCRGFSELDDVMHNTLGCMTGYGLFVMLNETRKWIIQR